MSKSTVQLRLHIEYFMANLSLLNWMGMRSFLQVKSTEQSLLPTLRSWLLTKVAVQYSDSV